MPMAKGFVLVLGFNHVEFGKIANVLFANTGVFYLGDIYKIEHMEDKCHKINFTLM